MTFRSLRTWLVAAAVAAMAMAALLAPVTATAAPGDDAVADGKAVVFDRKKGNCLACHEIAGGTLMGNVGPALNDMKKRYPYTDLLYQRIYDETRYNPMSVMPPFGSHKILTDKEVHDIVAYLLTL